MMPHLAEECWEVLGHTTFVAQSPWPVADRSLIVSNRVTYVAQVNGKKRGELTISGTPTAKRIDAPRSLSTASCGRWIIGLPAR